MEHTNLPLRLREPSLLFCGRVRLASPRLILQLGRFIRNYASE
jgi:hypothetical protein